MHRRTALDRRLLQIKKQDYEDMLEREANAAPPAPDPLARVRAVRCRLPPIQHPVLSFPVAPLPSLPCPPLPPSHSMPSAPLSPPSLVLSDDLPCCTSQVDQSTMRQGGPANDLGRGSPRQEVRM